jgi:O-antigen/teichoic acid export membrane protein
MDPLTALSQSSSQGVKGDGRASEQLQILAADLSTERLARGTRDNLVGIVVERLFGAALLIALPILLAPRLLGSYYEVVALLTLCVVLALLGLDVGITRFSALASEESRFHDVPSILRAGLLIATFSSTVLAAAVWIAAPMLARIFNEPSVLGAARVGSLSIPFLVGAYLLVAPSRGLKVMWPFVLSIQFAQPLVQLAATLALVATGFGLTGAIAAFTLSAIGAAFVALFMWVRASFPQDRRRSGQVLPLIRFSAPVSGMTLMGTALLWVDTLLLGAFRTSTEVSTYGIVVRLLTLSSAITFTVIQVFGPFVTQLAARGEKQRLSAVLKVATRWTFVLTGPVLVLLMVVSGLILRVFGQHFVGAGASAVVILGTAFLADGLTGPAAHVLTMSGRPAINLLNNAGALVTNVLLNVMLIPHLGLVGAAVSWAIVILGLAAARLVEVHILFGIGPLTRDLWRPAAALSFAVIGAISVQHFTTGPGTFRILLAIGAVTIVFVGIYILAMVVLGVEAEDRLLARLLFFRAARPGIEGHGPDGP